MTNRFSGDIYYDEGLEHKDDAGWWYDVNLGKHGVDNKGPFPTYIEAKTAMKKELNGKKENKTKSIPDSM